ncbi:MAG: aminotransferase class I/II-fold pyridoxal phosphate-dependent enzyme [Pseudomonadota bacterium]
MINEHEIDALKRGLAILQRDAETRLPPFTPGVDAEALNRVIDAVATKMCNNYPYFHPQYAGQMLKPPHPVARVAYALSLWINPNNHALDGSLASSPMEKECVGDLARMFGWTKHLGHLTSGGTVANLEALWVSGQLAPGKTIVGSSQAHYTHSRICAVLGLPYQSIESDANGRMRIDALQTALAQGNVGTVVATMGNTGVGAVDPLHHIEALKREHGFRIHADAAYGGYFTLSQHLGTDARQAYDALGGVDSIAIDPHKHGLQPYGCGCIVFKDQSVGTLYQHDSPYTYFSSDELHLGEISLECSRAGASAVGLWATHQMLPPVTGGAFAHDLDQCIEAAREFHGLLESSKTFVPLMAPELDIVCYAVHAENSEAASVRAKATFENAAQKELHLALIDLPTDMVTRYAAPMKPTTPMTTCLRSVLMKPEQKAWVKRIVDLLHEIAP